MAPARTFSLAALPVVVILVVSGSRYAAAQSPTEIGTATPSAGGVGTMAVSMADVGDGGPPLRRGPTAPELREQTLTVLALFAGAVLALVTRAPASRKRSLDRRAFRATRRLG